MVRSCRIKSGEEAVDIVASFPSEVAVAAESSHAAICVAQKSIIFVHKARAPGFPRCLLRAWAEQRAISKESTCTNGEYSHLVHNSL